MKLIFCILLICGLTNFVVNDKRIDALKANLLNLCSMTLIQAETILIRMQLDDKPDADQVELREGSAKLTKLIEKLEAIKVVGPDMNRAMRQLFEAEEKLSELCNKFLKSEGKV